MADGGAATFGLVLGAGGVVGSAYHAGTLTALAEAGVDARDAAVIVGTSAGSGVGAVLRAGFPPGDLVARATGGDLSDEAQAVVGHLDGPPEVDLRPRPLSRVPTPSSLGMALRSWSRPAKALAGLLPTGTVPSEFIAEAIDEIHGGQSWPDDPLWICAVRLRDGRLCVFGRDVLDVPIGTAVQASSAIPGFFRPAHHEGERYVDGGLRSPTNADLVADLGLDVVIVSSPMSATSAGLRSAGAGARPLHARRLALEVARLRAAGVEVVTVQPTPADVAVMGRNAMARDRTESTARRARESAAARFAERQVAERLDHLR